MTQHTPNDESSFRYDAFISYRHLKLDRKWAIWLHTALETYKIPQDILSQTGMTDGIKRVFRDEDELPAAGNLSAEIDIALEQSRFLIVVCSPDTPQSMWVNAEIERFRAMGRHDRILALLIKGDPDTSFPKALCQIQHTQASDDGSPPTQTVEFVEPLAADVRVENKRPMRYLKRMAQMRLTACIIGCRFDDLRQRADERSRKRRRNAIAAILTLTTAFGAITGWGIHQQNKEAEARTLAEQRLTEAIESIDPLVYESYSKLANRAGTRESQVDMNSTALQKIEKLSSGLTQPNAKLSHLLAVALRKGAGLYLLAGKTSQAGEMLNKALASLQQIDDPSVHRDTAQTLLLLGTLRERVGDLNGALDYYQQSHAMRSTIAQDQPDNREVKAELGVSLEFMGDTQLLLGAAPAANDLYQQSLTLRQALFTQDTSDKNAARDKSHSLSKIGDVQAILGDTATALSNYKAAAEIAEKLAKEDRYNTQAQRDWSVASSKLGDMSTRTSNAKAALQYYITAREIIQDLSEGDPGNAEWKREWALCVTNEGHALQALGNTTDALARFNDALQKTTDLSNADPQNTRLLRDLADAHQMVGGAHHHANQTVEAYKQYTTSRDIRKKLADNDDANLTLKRDLSLAYDRVADVSRKLGDDEAALKIYTQALDIREALAKADPDNAQAKRDITVSCLRLGSLSAPDQRLQWYQRAVQMRQELADANPSDTQLLGDLAVAHYLIGGTHQASGNLQKASTHYSEAISWFEAVASHDGADVASRRQLAVAHTQLATVMAQLKNGLALLQHLSSAADIRREIAQSLPNNASARGDLVISLMKLSEWQNKAAQLNEAQQTIDEAYQLVDAMKKADQLTADQQAWEAYITKRRDEIKIALGQ